MSVLTTLPGRSTQAICANRGVTGLGLDRLECHPGLPEPGQAGVLQLVTRRVRQTGAAPGTGEDLIESLCRYGLSTVGALEDHEHPVGVRVGWALGVEVGRDRSEEP